MITFRKSVCCLLALSGGLALGAATVAGAQEEPASQPASPVPASALEPVYQQLRQDLEAQGLADRPAALWIVRPERPAEQLFLGRYRADSRVPLASASEWLVAAAVLALADRGVVSLDDPLRRWLPQLGGEKGAITLRQLLTHTAGLPAQHPCLADRQTTLEACAAAILEQPLRSRPSEEFRHGSAGLQVIARVAELAAERSWPEIFEDVLARPLGMACTRYADTSNPWVGQGLRSCLRDWDRFLRLLLAGGELDGSRVLSEAAIAEMLRPQTGGAQLVYSPRPDAAGFGLGVWIDQLGTGARSGSAARVRIEGSAGWIAWLDFERRQSGVLAVVAPRGQVRPVAAEIRQRLRGLRDW